MRQESFLYAPRSQGSLIAEIKRALEGVVNRIDLYQHLFPSFPPTFNKDDIVILLLGETGSGRTTFIRNFTGQPLPAGSSLECDTQRIEFVPCVCPEFSDRRIVFIDTPGFNHKNRKELGDARILQLILTWFMAVYRNPPSAILYFYDMNAARIHCRLEEIARRLPPSTIILTTTMWDDLPEDALDGAVARENYLMETLSKYCVGAQTKEHPVIAKRLWSIKTHDALSILFDLVQKGNDEKRRHVEADLGDLRDSEGVKVLRETIQKQFQTLDDIRAKIRAGEEGYMSLDALKSHYIMLKSGAKAQVTALQRSKVAIPASITDLVQRDPHFGAWSKKLSQVD
ncbi:hypothetical protein CVT24_012223 [Panaeolus cyanescens]|uniref:G domain-containing protein n=1 Tax=Panaeolus cyanescens TaxID=181874 RepID=A0A409VYP6_9AGAR|nr:hypothetical protein CVT24_012223 [Panaeolus cyanescens]